MKIFVTGGTGFLGTRLIKRLQLEGHEVLGLARSERSAKMLTDNGVKAILGSLEDVTPWEERLQGVDIVIHCAALIGVWGKWQDFFNQITQATKKILAAADRQHVSRFIYISSESVMQDRMPLIDVDEMLPCPEKPNSYYGQSKLLAEKSILEYSGKMTSIILRPTFIYGPGASFSGDLKQMVEKNKFSWIDHGKHLMEHVHVDNVVEAINLSLNQGQDKGIYLITDGAPSTVREVLSKIAKGIDLNLPEKNVPGVIAKLAASLIESIWRIFRIQSSPPLTRFEVAFMAMPRRYKIDKAMRELGYRPYHHRD